MRQEIRENAALMMHSNAAEAQEPIVQFEVAQRITTCNPCQVFAGDDSRGQARHTQGDRQVLDEFHTGISIVIRQKPVLKRTVGPYLAWHD